MTARLLSRVRQVSLGMKVSTASSASGWRPSLMIMTRSWVIWGQTQCRPLAMEARERRQSSSAQTRTASVRGICCGAYMGMELSCYVHVIPLFLF